MGILYLCLHRKQKFMRYTDILLDLDDTLLDTATNTKETVKEIYTDYNLNNHFDSFNTFYSFYHTNVSKLWDAYNKGGISKDEIQRERFTSSLTHIEDFNEEKIQIINKDYIERVMKKDALVEGAIELLDHLKSRYKIHILSNGFSEMQYKKMESAKLASHYFENIILSDVVGVNKPHPDIFIYALNKIGAKKKNAIMIGDNLLTDINGAYNSGLDQIWYNPESKLSTDFKPTYTIRKLKEIKNIL